MPRQRILVIAVAIVIASTLVTPFTRELFVGDETKYSEVIREMRATGAWFLPTLEGRPFTHKPPLHFWIVDLLTVPFGVYSVWPYVIPSLIAFALLLWLFRPMSAELFDSAPSAAAAFVCGTSMLLWGSAQSARMDVSFTLLLSAAAWLMFRFFQRDDSRALLIAGVSLGVATLIKGPMAPVLAIVLFALEWWRRRRAPRRGYIAAAAAMIAIPLLWFVPAMVLGGGSYTHEVLQKQLANRAFSAWVHRSPPWYYVAHSPGFLFPWFLLFVVATVALYRRHQASDGAKFCISWIVAVLLPYSISSSKLDVYMMALVPPVALLIGNFVDAEPQDKWTAWGRAVNGFMMVLLVIVGATGLAVSPSRIKGPESAYLRLSSVRLLFVVLIAAAIVALVVVVRTKTLLASTIALGLVPIAMFVYAAAALMPVINEIASTRPLVAVLTQQRVPGDRIALYTAPHLWTHDMPRDLERVQYASPADLSNTASRPTLIVTSRGHAKEIAAVLAQYRPIAAVRMIGKWFDVYRR
jgi:4-amino-4-deoxy-L-arabinose transferase-like glycosyltransferase